MSEREPSTWQDVTTERLALADLLDGLSPQQWETPSLCPAWTVHGVLAHLVTVMEPGTLRRFLPAILRAGGRPHRASEAVVASRVRQESGPALVAALREHAGSRFAPPGLGLRAPLTDTLVHRLDIAVPLGLSVQRPVEPWHDALDFLLSPSGRAGLGAARGLPRLTYSATDLDWSHGTGAEVSGPAHALALSISGRPALLDDLRGPGLPQLRSWLGA